MYKKGKEYYEKVMVNVDFDVCCMIDIDRANCEHAQTKCERRRTLWNQCHTADLRTTV